MNPDWVCLPAWIVLVVLFGLCVGFEPGDTVPIEMKSQFSGQRTNWQHVLGHSAPTFNQNDLVVLQLDKPNTNSTIDHYKLQFAVNGDRLRSGWISIFRHKQKFSPTNVPSVRITFESLGREIKAVDAQVEPLDEELVKENADFLNDFANENTWPKRLVVEYEWVVLREVKVQAAYLTVLIAGVAFMAVVFVVAIQDFGSSMSRLMDTMSGEVAPTQHQD